MKVKQMLPAYLAERKIKAAKINQQSIEASAQTQLIVSFTSIPSRLHKLPIVIKSLLLQTRIPKKITLWLHEDLQHSLPASLTALCELTYQGQPILEIGYSPLTCSHRKLIHSLQAYPQSTIVNCDDDAIYPKNWLALLEQEHIKAPKDIICNRCNYISYDPQGQTLPYKQWNKNVHKGARSLAMMPAGYAGVLYPANSLHADAVKAELFLSLAPKADDLWFKAMSFLQGTYCKKAEQISEKPITLLGTQKFTLAKANIGLDQNKTQWDALRQHYQFITPQAPQQ